MEAEPQECPAPALLSLESHHRAFGEVFNLSRAGGDGVVDALGSALVMLVAWRHWHDLSLPDLAFLATNTVLLLGNTHWRRLHPGSYARWREWLALARRAVLAFSPATWRITRLALDRPVPFAVDPCPAWNAAAYLATVAFASCAACDCVLALARPVRLCFHLPAQAAMAAAAAAHSSFLCSYSALQHPSAVAATRRAHRWLTDAAVTVLPFTAAAGSLNPPRQQHEAPGGIGASQPLQQCCAVLSFSALLFGFALPTVLLAAAESRLFLDFQRRQLEQQQHQQQQQQHLSAMAGHPAGASSSALPDQRGPARGEGEGKGSGSRGSSRPEQQQQQQQQQQKGATGALGAAGQPGRRPARWRLPAAAVPALRWQPSDTALAAAYRALHGLLVDHPAADPCLMWLLEMEAAAAAWQAVSAACSLL